jgi:hypothetical protein
MTKQDQPQEAAAIQLLEQQLNQIAALQNQNSETPPFITWHSTVTDLFQRFLRPESPHLATFRNLTFRGPRQVGIDSFYALSAAANTPRATFICAWRPAFSSHLVAQTIAAITISAQPAPAQKARTRIPPRHPAAPPNMSPMEFDL